MPRRQDSVKGRNAPKWIRTTGLVLRRDALYPAELWALSRHRSRKRAALWAARAWMLRGDICWEANKPSSVFKASPITAPWRRIIYLGPRLLDVSSSLPGTLDAMRTRRGPRLVPYLALLRVGFTMPRLLPARAVVSYTTVSPLPVLTRSHRRSLLCCTFRRLATPGR